MHVNGKSYSRVQLELLKMLPKNGGQITTTELMQKRQAHGKWRVEFPRQGITGAMRVLIGKVDRHRERFRIRKSRPAGPREVHYWLEQKKETAK